MGYKFDTITVPKTLCLMPNFFDVAEWTNSVFKLVKLNHFAFFPKGPIFSRIEQSKYQ